MARIIPAAFEEISDEARTLWNEQVSSHGRMTNMKKTLAHSSLAFKVLMEWYPLRDRVATFLGDRTTTLFAHALSTQSDCLICSTFFRRTLIESGEDPDHLKMDEREEALIQYAQTLTKSSNNVTESLFQKLRSFLSVDQIVEVTTFAGMMIATNVFNNALKVDIDDYLAPYRGILKTSKGQKE